MASVRPQLLFVAGPEEGKRAFLMSQRMIAGRSNEADIPLSEDYVSRQQVLFALTRDGWLVENISKSNRITVNDKPYKAGKQILLETGDVVGVGAETKMLFVDSGDEPVEALEVYRQANPPESAETPPEVPQEAETLETKESPPPEPEPPEPPVAEAEEEEEESLSLEEQQQRARSRRMKKIAVGLGIYLAAMLAVFLLLWQMDEKDGPGGGADAPEPLRDEEIREALREPLEREQSPSKADLHLRRAREHFSRRLMDEVNWYLCVKNYRLYLAYKSNPEVWDTLEDENNYNEAVEELSSRVYRHYYNAYLASKKANWLEARNQFDKVLQYLPIGETREDKPVYEGIVRNVRKYQAYVAAQSAD